MGFTQVHTRRVTTVLTLTLTLVHGAGGQVEPGEERDHYEGGHKVSFKRTILFKSQYYINPNI